MEILEIQEMLKHEFYAVMISYGQKDIDLVKCDFICKYNDTSSEVDNQIIWTPGYFDIINGMIVTPITSKRFCGFINHHNKSEAINLYQEDIEKVNPNIIVS